MEQEINGKVQKINDEDYEIIKVIESQSRIDAIKWYQENYDSSVEDAINAISAIYKKYKGGYKPDATEVFLLAVEYGKEDKNPDKTRERIYKWLNTNGSYDWDDVTNLMYEGLKLYKQNDENGKSDTKSENKKGCMITILIAITTTLSALWLLYYNKVWQ